jgi:tight adherence protein C
MDIMAQSMILIVGVGFCLFVTIIILGVGTYLFLYSYEPSQIEIRLQSLKQSSGREFIREASTAEKIELMANNFINSLKPFAMKMYGKNAAYIESVKISLTQAGLPDSDEAVQRFFAKRIAMALLLGAVFVFITLIAMQPFTIVLMGSIIGLLMGLLLPQMQLKGRAKRRQEEIRFTLADTLDLLVVCLEAGLGLDATIQRVGEECVKMAPDLSIEFKRLNKELIGGIQRADAFHNVAIRTGVDELRALCALIIQTDKLGTSIAETLRIYADDVRTKKRQKAELLASQASIKMTFPLVFLIFPPLFIVLIGPAVMQAFGTFFQAPAPPAAPAKP